MTADKKQKTAFQFALHQNLADGAGDAGTKVERVVLIGFQLAVALNLQMFIQHAYLTHNAVNFKRQRAEALRVRLEGGFPSELQEIVLKGKKPIEGRAGALMPPSKPVKICLTP